MQFETIIFQEAPRQLTLTISRPHRGNSINSTLIHELGAALDLAESWPECRTVVLEGTPGLFCTGMDFHEASTNSERGGKETVRIADYLLLLNRLTLSSKVIVCRLDGKV